MLALTGSPANGSTSSFILIENQNHIKACAKTEKTLFEQIGGAYRQVGDYILPNISLPKEQQLLAYGDKRHLRYLKQHRKVLYYNLLTSGNLNGHLADVDHRAQTMFDDRIAKTAKPEGVTEKLKA